MRWTIAGCCGFVLISLSVALQISQKPRFYGLRPGANVPVYCKFSDQTLKIPVKWFKAEHFDANREEIGQNKRIHFWRRSMVENALLNIKTLTLEDSGVYFCSINGTWGPGTEIQVVRPFDVTKAQYRTQMKDGLIVLQGLLLAVCIAAFLLRKQKLVKDNDSLYEEPETDHIYEGLAIETCGEGLYEDLTAYARAEGAEAPWE
ncbi:B-cell antigen receptor complex-associated protein beta chain isoform 1-T1 [Fundulus diaphanus]